MVFGLEIPTLSSIVELLICKAPFKVFMFGVRLLVRIALIYL